jgi:hypothetical protein
MTQRLNSEQLCSLDSPETSTKASTEIDTDVSSSAGTEVEDKAINLCDVVNEFMQKSARKDEEIERVRLQAQTLLLQAAFEGNLRDKFAQAKEETAKSEKELTGPPQDEVFDKVRAALQTAALNGHLSQTFAAVSAPKPSEQKEDSVGLMDRLRDTFQSAALNGRLAQTLAEVPVVAPTTEKAPLFEKARATLCTAAFDGRLANALAEMTEVQPPEQKPETKSLCLSIKETLLAAASDGRLQAAVKEAKQDLPCMANKAAIAPADREVSQKQPPTSLEILRSKMRATLQKGAVDGRLDEAIKAVQANKVPSVEALRLKARQMFMDTAANGKLEEVFGAVSQAQSPSLDSARKQVRNTLFNAAQDGSFERAIDAVRQLRKPQEHSGDLQLETLRAQARRTILQGLKQGNLVDVVEKVKKERGAPVEAPQSPSDGDALREDLRLKLRTDLCTAAQSGALDDALQKANQAAEVEELRIQARETLLKGFHDGSLERSFTELNGEETDAECDIDKLRLQVRDKITAAAQDGRLKALLEVDQGVQIRADEGVQTIEDIRAKARHTILNAARDGRLTETFDEVKGSNAEHKLETLRKDMKDVLLNGLYNGHLQSALQSRYEKKSAESIEEGSTDSLFQRARQALVQGAFSGQLGTAFSQVASPSDKKETPAPSVEALRLEMRNTFLSAVQSGSLQRTLADLKKQSDTPPIGELRARARVALEAALGDGTTSAEDDRRAMREMFVKAEGDGSLQNALAKVSEAPVVAESKPDKVADICRQACCVLLESAQNGKLAAALTDVVGHEPVVDVCRQARCVLLESAQNGKLAAALTDAIGHEPVQPMADIDPVSTEVRSAFETGLQAETSEQAPEPVSQSQSEEPVLEVPATPAKPTSAKGSSRPVRHRLRPEVSTEATDSASNLVASSKNSRNRHIIGGVARGLAEEPEPPIAAPSPSRRSKVVAVRMDVIEASAMEMDTGDVASLRIAPGSKMKRPSKTPNSATTAAIAMDLGEEAPLPSYSSTLSARSSRNSHSVGSVQSKVDLKAFSKLPSVFQSAAGASGKMQLPTQVGRKRGAVDSLLNMQLGSSAVQWDMGRAGF